MEQHAVPQDITGFKFKLVGDMTLLQFGQLAGGFVVAWILFASPLHPFLKYPSAAFFALLGVGLAFVPIEERPMHVWIFNFFKAIYRPTYFIWRRRDNDGLQTPPKMTAAPSTTPDYRPTPINMTTLPLNDDSLPLKTPEEVPTNTPHPPIPPVGLPATPTKTLSPQNINSAAPVSIADLMKAREQNGTVQTTSVQPVNNPSSNQKPITIEELVKKRAELSSINEQKAAMDLGTVEKKISDLTEQNKQLLMQIDEIRNKLYQNPNQNVSVLNKDLDDLIEKKNVLANQIAATRDQLNEARVAPLTNSFYQEPVNVKRIEKVVPKETAKQTLVSLTSIPNVVNGLVMDSAGKPIDGAILIMKDQNRNSIRALRTNRVGQFIASTPLSDGTYFIETEKPDFVFDVFQISLSGQVLEPLEIRAKTQEVLAKN